MDDRDVLQSIADSRLERYLDSLGRCSGCGVEIEDGDDEEHDCYTREDFLADQADRDHDERGWE